MKEPNALQLESIAFEKLHFPLFAWVEASPKLVFTFTASSAV
jgi:hypothetical protein